VTEWIFSKIKKKGPLDRGLEKGAFCWLTSYWRRRIILRGSVKLYNKENFEAGVSRCGLRESAIICDISRYLSKVIAKLDNVLVLSE